MSASRGGLKNALPERLRLDIRSIWYAVRSMAYGGDRVVCPVCGGQFSRFLSFGLDKRPNAQCPRCGCLERHRLLWLYLKDRTRFFEQSLKVLEFAPTLVLQRRFRRMKNLDYVSADLSSSVAMLRMDITQINFPDDRFDAIICYHVLEHVLDDRKAISELFRVLKPGGWAILQSPIDMTRDETFEAPDVTSPQDRERVFGQSDHVRIYGRDYRDRLEQAGFNVRLDDYVRDLGPEQAVKCGLMTGEKIHFCTKPDRDR
jgi:predicted SAM-dependent methyltransferase